MEDRTTTEAREAVLLEEYHICNDRVESVSQRCWLDASLFIGASYAALALLLTAEKRLDPLVPAIGSLAAILTLISLKRFLINEEWRNALCHSRMWQIERQLGMEITRATSTLSSPHFLTWIRLPWDNRFRPGEKSDSVGKDWGVEPRLSFGWEFLHFSVWVSTAAWLLYGTLYTLDYYQVLRPEYWNSLVAAVVLALAILSAVFGGAIFGDWRGKNEDKMSGGQHTGSGGTEDQGQASVSLGESQGRSQIVAD